MFISIKWKNTVVFTLMLTAVMSIICLLQVAGILSDVRNEFVSTVNSVFTEEYIAEINSFAASAGKNIDTYSEGGELLSRHTEDDTGAIFNKAAQRAYDLSIGHSRVLYLLDKNGNILNSTSNAETAAPQNAFVLPTGEDKSGFKLTMNCLDYYLKTSTISGNECIIYISDNNEHFSAVLKRTVFLYIKCMVAVLILCFIMGMWLAKSITVPLKKLNVWAKQLSDGKTDVKNDITANDELGALAKTLEAMARSLDESAAQTNNEKIKLETILQNMTDGILAFNLDGHIIHINPEAQKLLGIQFLDGIVFDSFFKEIQANISMGDLLYAKPEGGNIERSITIDKTRFLRLNFATFSIKNKVGGIVVVIHDITKQQKLDQSRRDFVANVSHELRTPLTTIKSYAETLSDTPDAPKELSSSFLSVIASEADRMARIISDLLTLSELDDKSPVYKLPEPIDLRKMVRAVTDRMQIDAKQKKQTLVYNPINDVPIINGDRDGLERVIVNIVSNAIKYTPEGGTVNIYTSCVYNDICIKIIDNGIGIPKENLPNIFERFYRVDKARSRGTGGTGLGLAIAKQTIESAFNGKIKITSEVNKGTEVSITIPVKERN